MIKDGSDVAVVCCMFLFAGMWRKLNYTNIKFGIPVFLCYTLMSRAAKKKKSGAKYVIWQNQEESVNSQK
jgi:hypothetical protein